MERQDDPQEEGGPRGELPRWAPRVPPDKIRRLYESEARGMVDETLLDDVAIGFYLRCKSVAAATTAMRGEVECPRCATVIVRLSPYARDGILSCPNPGCAWQLSWQAYQATFQHKQLFWGGAFPAVRDYIEGFDRARTAREKLLLIDRLIHACHWQMTNHPGRPAAMLVIAGRESEVVALIEGLAYGGSCEPELREAHSQWAQRRQGPSPDALPWKTEWRAVVDAGYYEAGDAFARGLRGTRPEDEEG